MQCCKLSKIGTKCKLNHEMNLYVRRLLKQYTVLCKDTKKIVKLQKRTNRNLWWNSNNLSDGIPRTVALISWVSWATKSNSIVIKLLLTDPVQPGLSYKHLCNYLIDWLIQWLILCETVYTTKEVDTGSLLTVPSVL